MKSFAIVVAAAGCLAFAIPPALAMSNTGPSDVSAKSGMSNQTLAQAQYNSTKKKDQNNPQDQTRRRSWGGGGY
jgi:opacity protein-like surface antigen